MVRRRETIEGSESLPGNVGNHAQGKTSRDTQREEPVHTEDNISAPRGATAIPTGNTSGQQEGVAMARKDPNVRLSKDAEGILEEEPDPEITGIEVGRGNRWATSDLEGGQSIDRQLD